MKKVIEIIAAVVKVLVDGKQVINQLNKQEQSHSAI